MFFFDNKIATSLVIWLAIAQRRLPVRLRLLVALVAAAAVACASIAVSSFLCLFFFFLLLKQ